MAFKIVCDGKLCKNEALNTEVAGWRDVKVADMLTSLIQSKHLCPTCYGHLFEVADGTQ